MSLDVYLEMEVDTGGPETHRVELYESNITHNLGYMAREAGIYKHLWRPEELGIELAGELIAPLRAGLKLLRSDPLRFEALNPSNGWGTYENFVTWLDDYIKACTEHPKATVRVWR